MPKIKSVKSSTRDNGSASAAGGSSGSSTGRTLLSANTSIGQHFLKNPAVVDAIIAKSQIRPTDIVMEVGPGTGNLTVRLLEVAKKVVAVEFDRRMVGIDATNDELIWLILYPLPLQVREVLKRVEGTEKEHHLSVIQGDVLKVQPACTSTCCIHPHTHYLSH